MVTEAGPSEGVQGKGRKGSQGIACRHDEAKGRESVLRKEEASGEPTSEQEVVT